MSDNNSKSTLNGQGIAFLLFILIGGFFLWAEHRAHIMGALPYLIFLLCPIMHIFMHKGHGGHNGKHDDHSNHQGGTS
ncbi:MAG: DUF2933 domain-containing protein [Desulfobulbaceae bacterium]|nr:DUF2933 domain-containing protein [Desulfobulbaceae bacterium]